MGRKKKLGEQDYFKLAVLRTILGIFILFLFTFMLTGTGLVQDINLVWNIILLVAGADIATLFFVWITYSN